MTAGYALTLSKLPVQEIIARLAKERNQASGLDHLLVNFHPEPPRPAAVLIPFIMEKSEWHLLFIRRTEAPGDHSGQVAFPGGRMDPQDASPEYTALREAREEIGLEPADVTVLGILPQITTITNYLVTPVAGRIPWPYQFLLAQEEVSRIFLIPLSWLVDPNHYHIHPPQLHQPYGTISTIFFEPYEGELLWGVTARIVVNLAHTLIN